VAVICKDIHRPRIPVKGNDRCIRFRQARSHEAVDYRQLAKVAFE